MKKDVGVLQLKIIRTVFEDSEQADGKGRRFILVLDMEDETQLSTAQIPDLAKKMELALPGIFPDDDNLLAHTCGGGETSVAEHSFREEIERGTNIAHLLEHVLLHLLSRRSLACSAYCGQRSIDIERGITTHFYLVLDCPSKLEAIIAADLGFSMVQAWVLGRTVTIDADTVLSGIHDILGPMLNQAA